MYCISSCWPNHIKLHNIHRRCTCVYEYRNKILLLVYKKLRSNPLTKMNTYMYRSKRTKSLTNIELNTTYIRLIGWHLLSYDIGTYNIAPLFITRISRFLPKWWEISHRRSSIVLYAQAHTILCMKPIRVQHKFWKHTQSISV